MLQDFYGEEHFKTAIRLGNLGLLYRSLGDLKKAKDCCEKALPVLEKFIKESNEPDEHGIVDTTQKIKAFLATLKKSNNDEEEFPGNQPTLAPIDQPSTPPINSGASNNIQQNRSNETNSMAKLLLKHGFLKFMLARPVIEQSLLRDGESPEIRFNQNTLA